MPRPETKIGPEWRGNVLFFNGKRWIDVPIGVRSRDAHVASARAIRQARKTLKPGMHIEEIRVHLRKIKESLYAGPAVGD